MMLSALASVRVARVLKTQETRDTPEFLFQAVSHVLPIHDISTPEGRTTLSYYCSSRVQTNPESKRVHTAPIIYTVVWHFVPT